jgi:N-acylneuraminate cytidylyltransferase
MSGQVVAFIFARGGSKGVPRKNLRLLGGRPLLAHAIGAAQEARSIHEVVVSTEDEEIAEVAQRWGAAVPFRRPAELASDDAPEWLAWQHAIREWRRLYPERDLTTFVCIPTTAPLRLPEDIDRCVAALQAGSADVALTVTDAHRNPYFNMVTIGADGLCRLAIPSVSGVTRRQSAPAMYDITTVAYAARPDYVLTAQRMLEGRIRAVVVPTERALDIDTEFDLQIAEFLFSRRQQQGTLRERAA